jgi:hypothetical protein
MHAGYACYPHEFCFAVLVGMMKKQKLLGDYGRKDANYYQGKLDEEKEVDGNQSQGCMREVYIAPLRQSALKDMHA